MELSSHMTEVLSYQCSSEYTHCSNAAALSHYILHNNDSAFTLRDRNIVQ